MSASSGRTGLYAMAGIAFIAIGYALQNTFFMLLGGAALAFLLFQRYRDRFGKPNGS